MKKISRSLFLFMVPFTFSLVPFVVSAAGPPTPPPPAPCTAPACVKCDTPAREATCRQEALFQSGGYATNRSTSNIPGRIGVLITVVASVTGAGFTFLVVYSGIQWMLAGEKEEVVKKAKTRITRATIGLLIVLGSWALVNFVLRGLTTPSSGDNFIQIRTLP